MHPRCNGSCTRRLLTPVCLSQQEGFRSGGGRERRPSYHRQYRLVNDVDSAPRSLVSPSTRSERTGGIVDRRYPKSPLPPDSMLLVHGGLEHDALVVKCDGIGIIDPACCRHENLRRKSPDDAMYCWTFVSRLRVLLLRVARTCTMQSMKRVLTSGGIPGMPR